MTMKNLSHERAGCLSLFFFKQRPHFWGVSLKSKKIVDEDVYQKMIYEEGFVSIRYDQTNSIDFANHPVILQDLKDLDNILLPMLFDYNQQTKYWKNQFYLYQWFFIFGACLTTLLGSIATLLYIPPGLSAAATMAAENSQNLSAVNWQQFFGILTAVIAVFTAFIFTASNRGPARQQWLDAQRMEEDLRTIYFKYLSHAAPFENTSRFDKLREFLVEIRGRSTTKGSLTGITLSERNPHNQDDVDLLLNLYISKQINTQSLACRIILEDGQQNLNFTFMAAVTFLAITVIAALVSSVVSSPFFSLLSAILPSIASLLYAFQLLYGWDQQIPMYRNALEELRNIEVVFNENNALYGEDKRIFMKSILGQLDNVTSIIQGQSAAVQRVQQDLVDKEERVGVIETKPMFGVPPTQRQFICDVFMIMPFAEEFAPIYKERIKHVTSKLDLTIKRGDDFFSEHSIMDEIWAGIYNARLVIAECTGRNANVYYELGIAHTLGKPAIMITQNLEDTPFDLRHLRTIVYKNTPEGLAELEIQLKDAIERLT